MRRILLCFGLILAIGLSAKELNRAIGMSAGFISGTGISYRVMEGKTGYQFAGGHYATYDNGLKNSGSNISASVYHNLVNTGRSRFYLLAGATFYDVYRRTKHYYYSDVTIENWRRNYLNVGAGIGWEFPLTEYFHMSIEWPWYYDNRAEFVKFIPQAGFHYYFQEKR